jgi:type I restriction enzyme, S subunit
VKDFHANDAKFVYYWLQTLGLQHYDVGASNPTLNRNHVHLLRTRVPEPPIQRKIAAILFVYDDLIEKNQRRIKVLEEMAQRIYREWFVDFRYPGHENVPLVDSALGLIPQGWEVGVLDDLVVLQRGFDLPQSQRQDGAVPVIAASGRHGTHSEAKVNGPGVVTGRSGSLGSVEYVVEDFWPLNTTLWVKKYGRATPESAYFLLRSLGLAGFNSGSAVPTLNRNDISQLAHPLAPEALVSQFSEHARDILAAVRVLERSTEVLQTTRDLVLPHLISGAIDVTNLDVAMPDVAA